MADAAKKPVAKKARVLKKKAKCKKAKLPKVKVGKVAYEDQREDEGGEVTKTGYTIRPDGRVLTKAGYIDLTGMGDLVLTDADTGEDLLNLPEDAPSEGQIVMDRYLASQAE